MLVYCNHTTDVACNIFFNNIKTKRNDKQIFICEGAAYFRAVSETIRGGNCRCFPKGMRYIISWLLLTLLIIISYGWPNTIINSTIHFILF